MLIVNYSEHGDMHTMNVFNMMDGNSFEFTFNSKADAVPAMSAIVRASSGVQPVNLSGITAAHAAQMVIQRTAKTAAEGAAFAHMGKFWDRVKAVNPTVELQIGTHMAKFES